MGKRVLWTVGFFLFPVVFLQAGERHLLRYDWQVGQVHTHQFHLNDTFQFRRDQTGGVGFQNLIQFRFFVREEVVSRQGDIFHIRWQFRRLIFYRRQAKLVLRFDTHASPEEQQRNPLTQIISPVLQELLKHTILFHVDTRGQVKKVVQQIDLWQRVSQKLIPAFQAYFRRFLEPLLSEPALQAMFQAIHPVLPKPPVREGESWSALWAIPHLGGTGVFQFTLSRVFQRQGKTYWLILAKSELKIQGVGRGIGGFRYRFGQGQGRFLVYSGGVVRLLVQWKLRLVLPGDQTEVSGIEKWESLRTKGERS